MRRARVDVRADEDEVEVEVDARNERARMEDISMGWELETLGGQAFCRRMRVRELDARAG